MRWTNLIKGFRQGKNKKTIKKPLLEHYDIQPIDDTGAVYRMIIGQRSNGKTYKCCRHIVEDYLKEGKRGAYVRRYEETLTPKNLGALFDPHNDFIKELSDGRYNCAVYRSKEYHLVYMDMSTGEIIERDPVAFCVTDAINTAENTKGMDRGPLHTIVFDEFVTRVGYLNNEFVQFMNLLSSLIRDRDDAVIYMLANTVNKYCPYFKEMGLKNIESLPKGEIALYTYGDSRLTVAVEVCDEVLATKKVASKYFAFGNPQLQMITKGEWEFQIYPRAPYKIYAEDIVLVFYIRFAENMLCCEIVHPTVKAHCNDVFIFIHPQTKDVEVTDSMVMYVQDFSSCRMHVRFLKDQPTEAHKLICGLVQRKSVCFSDNDTGEIFRNWLMETQGVKLW